MYLERISKKGRHDAARIVNGRRSLQIGFYYLDGKFCHYTDRFTVAKAYKVFGISEELLRKLQYEIAPSLDRNQRCYSHATDLQPGWAGPRGRGER